MACRTEVIDSGVVERRGQQAMQCSAGLDRSCRPSGGRHRRRAAPGWPPASTRQLFGRQRLSWDEPREFVAGFNGFDTSCLPSEPLGIHIELSFR